MMTDYDKMLFYKKQCTILNSDINVAKERVLRLERELEEAKKCQSGAEFELKMCKQFFDLYSKRVKDGGGTETTATIDIS